MAPSTQKALEVHAIGSPLVLVTDRPVPSPEADQILVQVTVAGINPHDAKCRDWGLFIAENLPAVLTNDTVGRIVRVGSGVTHLKEGDRVVGQAKLVKSSAGNGLQQFALLEADFVSKIPAGVSDDEAATLPTNIIPALVALYSSPGFKLAAPWSSPKADLSHEALLIIGGGSNCGRFAVQLASLGGLGNIVVLGGDAAELESYGATTVLSRAGSPDEIAARIAKALPRGAKYVFDTINPLETQYIGINALTESGGKYARLLPLGTPAAENIKRRDWELIDVHGSSHVHPEVSKEFWSRLGGYLETGKVRPLKFTVLEGLDADKVNAVLDRYRDGEKVTKTHVHVHVS